MSSSGDKGRDDRTSHHSEGNSREIRGASGKNTGDASDCDLGEAYYKEKSIQK